MESIQALKESLIYRMSLGSKELYHSNVWAWLIEIDPNFIEVFCPNEGMGSRVTKVEREEGNRDLTIYLNSSKNAEPDVIIVENKLKSIPSKEQLLDYQKEVGERFKQGILTGITLPVIAKGNDFVDVEGRKWKFIDYPTISERILEIANSSKHELIKNNLAIIKEYCDCILHMNSIVKDFDNGSIKPIWSEELDDLGLQDLINKVRGSRFMRYFDQRILEDGIPFALEEFEHWQDFHNKKTTLDFRFHAKNGFVIGIQIEGDEFRRVIQFPNKPGEKDQPLQIHGQFSDVWFDGSYNESKGNKQRRINWPGLNESFETKLTGKFNKYWTSNYCFVYQYATLNECALGFEPLYQFLMQNLKLARPIFENYK